MYFLRDQCFFFAATVVATLFLSVLATAPARAAYYFYDDWAGRVGLGPGSAWGVENATDPNNPAVHYYNTTPSQSTTARPTTLQVINDATSPTGRALRMTIRQDPNFASNGIYQSAEISTKLGGAPGNNIQYGHVEACIKVAGSSGQGADSVWPAFWMLGANITTSGWPKCGEIDIMEAKGSQMNVNQVHLHGPVPPSNGDYLGGIGVGGSYTLPGGKYMYQDYHIYAIDWSPGKIVWSIDGTSYLTETPTSSNFISSGGTWVFDGHPFYLIFDICQGKPFADTGHALTQTLNMDVAYVSVTALPEPATLAMLSAAASGVLLRRRRRR
jgi:beta-glucanase (GH16 family)